MPLNPQSGLLPEWTWSLWVARPRPFLGLWSNLSVLGKTLVCLQQLELQWGNCSPHLFLCGALRKGESKKDRRGKSNAVTVWKTGLGVCRARGRTPGDLNLPSRRRTRERESSWFARWLHQPELQLQLCRENFPPLIPEIIPVVFSIAHQLIGMWAHFSAASVLFPRWSVGLCACVQTGR